MRKLRFIEFRGDGFWIDGVMQLDPGPFGGTLMRAYCGRWFAFTCCVFYWSKRVRDFSELIRGGMMLTGYAGSRRMLQMNAYGG